MAKKSKSNKKAKAPKKVKKVKKAAPKAKKAVSKKTVKKAVKKTAKPAKKTTAKKVTKTKVVAAVKTKKEIQKKPVKAEKLIPIEDITIDAAPRRPGRQPKPKIKKIKKIFKPFNPIQISAEKVITKKEPKGKFEMEFVMRCSEPLLYDFFTTPSGMSEWFADNVNIRDGLYTFFWEGSKQEANLIALKEDSFAKYQWVDKTDGSYFQFRIQTDDLTGDVSLMITDFAETKDDEASARLLWESQVEKLKKKLGSFT